MQTFDPTNFATLARRYRLLPTEVAAVVLSCGARVIERAGSKFVDPADLPTVIPLLETLRDRKHAMRPVAV